MSVSAFPYGVISAAAIPSVITSLAGTQASHHNSNFGSPCFAGVRVDNNGTEYSYSNAGSSTGNNLGPWLERGTTAEVWIRCTSTGGIALSGSATGVWLATTTDRMWYISTSAPGSTVTSNLTIETATDAGGANIIDSETYSLSAEVT